MIDQAVLDILACPLSDSRPPLELRGEHLYCAECDCYFPIVNGIPNLLPEAAIPAAELNASQP